MDLLTIGLVSLFTGIFASLGLGGGMALIIYLTVFAGVNQINVQGINLIFFIPIAILSLIIHTKSHLVEWKKIVPALITGTITVIIFSLLADRISNEILQRLFGVFVAIMGIRELLTKSTADKPKAFK